MNLSATERGMKTALAYGRTKAMLKVLQSDKNSFDKLRGIFDVLDTMRIFGSRVNSYAYKRRIDLLEKEWLIGLPVDQLPPLIGLSKELDELIEARLKEVKNE